MQTPLVNGDYLLQKFPGKGGWTYALLPEVAPDRSAHFGWVTVKGTIDDFPLKNYRLMPMGKGQLFLPVNATVRKTIKKAAGDLVHIVLYADKDPLEIPEELLTCLKDDPHAHKIFRSYSEGEQRAFIKWIYSAKTDETRVRRITSTLLKLSRGLKLHFSK